MKLPAHNRKALLLTAAMLQGKHFHSRNKKWWSGWRWLLFTNQGRKNKKGHHLYISKLTHNHSKMKERDQMQLCKHQF